jgi:hypothetical protein
MWSTKEFVDYFSRIEYRDFDFEIHQTDWEGPFVRIRCQDDDNFNPGEKIDLGINSLLCIGSEEEMDRWLAWRLIRLASHEVREQLKKDGKVIFNPHAEGEPYHM